MDRSGAAAHRPPRLPFVLSVGVTGHRLDALPPDSLSRIEQRIREALELVSRQAKTIAAEQAEFFADEPPQLRFISPLADGADQIAAEVALSLGFSLTAVLPFARDEYRLDMPENGARARFDALLERGECMLELPGERADAHCAYLMAGRATVAHADVLLAVWDGLPPRGRGGTGEVVELAVAAGTPVIHVPVAEANSVTIRWSAYDPAVVTRAPDASTARPFTPEQVERLVTALLTPPPDARERRFLSGFQGERSRRWRARIEYPLLLAIAGIARFGTKDWQAKHCSAATQAEWEKYRQECCDPHGVNAPIAPLEQWYDWSDRLASHFAQSYRSGHVFNFIFAAIAVLTALSALILPHLKPYLASAEFAFILAILVNTRIGLRHEWHRRWLDYRQLAERLRPMRSLKLLGIAAPDPPGDSTNPVAGRWIDWYAAAVWRAIGCVDGRIDAAAVAPISRAISCHELRPQIAYHRSSASQIHRLDHRLERIGTAIFAASLLSCVVLIAALRIDYEWVTRNFSWFIIASAGLPAIGTAIFGIRFQGDFGGSALRSEATAHVLDQIAREMESPGVSLGRAADLMEQAGRAMLADLDEWRLINQQHDLTVG